MTRLACLTILLIAVPMVGAEAPNISAVASPVPLVTTVRDDNNILSRSEVKGRIFYSLHKLTGSGENVEVFYDRTTGEYSGNETYEYYNRPILNPQGAYNSLNLLYFKMLSDKQQIPDSEAKK